MGVCIVTLRVLRLEFGGVSSFVTAFNPLSLTIDALGVSFARHAPARDIRLPEVDRRGTEALAGSFAGQKASSD